MLRPHHDAEEHGRSGDTDPGVPALAAASPAEQRVDPHHALTAVDVLVANVIASLEMLGEMTAREPEAEGLIRVVRAEFGG